jgi:type IV pilus assembly protein PilE
MTTTGITTVTRGNRCLCRRRPSDSKMRIATQEDRPADGKRLPPVNQGFTLLEILIVVVIVGVLATIAYPSYQEQMRKSRRTEAQAALTNLATQLELHLGATGTYLDSDGSELSIDTLIGTDGGDTEHGYYAIGYYAITAENYTLEAIPLGDQAEDGCGQFRLTDAGTKWAAGGSGCW